MSLGRRLRKLTRGDASHVVAADVRPSVISSAVDLLPRPTPELIRLALEASSAADTIDLAEVAGRCRPQEAQWVRLWPGEHYRLLAGLVRSVQPTTVVEIGTFQGLGSLALLDQLPANAQVVTFDVIPWEEIEHSALKPSDFEDGRLHQELGDLSDPQVFEKHRELLERADMVFVDAPKDGVFEPAFLDLAVPLWRGSRRLVVFDDVRLMPMVQLWRDLPFPKLDITSFGHWSGTGLALTE